VFPERLGDQFRLLHGVDGFVEIARQRGYPQSLPLAFGEGPDIVFRTFGSSYSPSMPASPAARTSAKAR
jgi:hypothetical protein